MDTRNLTQGALVTGRDRLRRTRAHSEVGARLHAGDRSHDGLSGVAPCTSVDAGSVAHRPDVRNVLPVRLLARGRVEWAAHHAASLHHSRS